MCGRPIDALDLLRNPVEERERERETGNGKIRKNEIKKEAYSGKRAREKARTKERKKNVAERKRKKSRKTPKCSGKKERQK